MVRGQGGHAVSIGVVLALVLVACTTGDDASPSTPPGETVQRSTPELDADGSVGHADHPELPPPVPAAVVAATSTTDAVVGEQVDVTAYVLTDEPIATVELWAGPEPVDSVATAGSTTATAEVLTWTPTEAGLEALVVRVIDDAQHVAQSFPVWVRVADDEPPAAPLGLRRVTGPLRVARAPSAVVAMAPPPPGITVGDGCALEVEVSAAAVSGTAVYGAALGAGGFALLDVVGSAGGTVPVDAGSGPVVLFTQGYDAAAARWSPPSAPVVTPDCEGGAWDGPLGFEGAVLTADVDQAYLYVTSDDVNWQRVPAADQTFVSADADGRFDFTGMLPPTGPGGSVTVEGWGWRAGALVALGRSTFTVDEAPGTGTAGTAQPIWSVVPGLPILPANGSLDWVLSTFDASDIENPVAGEALVRDALWCTFSPTGEQVLLLPGECANSPDGDIPSTTFRWTPAPGSFTHGIWQVSVVPPPEAPVLAFPGMIATGPVAKPSGSTTDFDIPDLAAYLASTTPPSGEASTSVNANAINGPAPEELSFEMVSEMAAAAIGGGSAGPSEPAGTGLTFSLPPSWTGSIGGVALPITPVPTALYVRVVPVDGVQPQQQTSNPVIFSLDHTAPPPPQPPPDPAFTIAATMQPPTKPNTVYSHCLRVVENPFGSKNPPSEQHKDTTVALFFQLFEQQAFMWENGVKVHKGLVPGATVCALEPSPPDDNWYDVIVDAVNGVVWVWDLFADVYGMLKEQVIDALVFASGCEAFLDEDDCHALGGLVVSIAAMYVGLPPTMPNFGELVEAAKSDLKAWVIESAVQAGILDCGSTLQSTCEELADEMLDELLDTIQAEATKAATAQAKSGGYTLLLNPAITVVPEPAGLLAPAVFDVTLTRTEAPSTVTSCKVAGAVLGNTTWSWDADDGYHTNEKVNELLMSGSTSVDVTGLAPGQSVNVTLVLSELYDVFLPGQPPWKGSFINPEYDPSSWVFLIPPAVLTLTAGSPCAAGGNPPLGGSVATTWPQVLTPPEPWQIP